MKSLTSCAFCLWVFVASGCGTYQYVPPSPEQQARTQAALAQLAQQSQRDQANMNAIYSQHAENRRNASASYPTNLQMSNGYPNNQSVVQQTPQMPTGLGGTPTGRTKMGLDGTTYREVRDVNGTLYWTNK